MWSHWITDANLCRKCFQFYCCKFPIGVILFRIFHCIATDWEIFLALEKCSFVKVSTMSTVSPCKKCQQCHLVKNANSVTLQKVSTVSPIASILTFWTLFRLWMRKVVRQNWTYKITKKNTFLGLGQGQRPGWCHYWREKGVQQGRLQEHEGFVRIFLYFYILFIFLYQGRLQKHEEYVRNNDF